MTWGAVAVVGLLVAALVVWPASTPAHAGDPRIERAQEQRRQAQQHLDGVLQHLRAVEAEVARAEAELAGLTSKTDAHREDARQATAAVAHLAQTSYRYGSADPTLALLASDSPDQAMEHARLLGVVARQGREGYEAASAARIRTQVAAEEADRVAATLAASRDELERTRREAAGLVATAQREEEEARTVVAAEQAAAARARAAREAAAAAASRPARGGSSSSAPADGPVDAPASAPASAAAPVAGGVACPVGRPHSYSDTWGAARSGGRAHKGTDILAARGIPIYAYESGVVSRLNSNRLGGISLYLQGNSGNRYYYTHLQGYVAGLSAGQQVSAGQQIAINGDTGNARGIPHLHFEVFPGGGGNANPYPYVRRACG
ncbi:MAG: peptidoglycan DD-metalloendopeptidase family protein [Egibacteraceae bacterium]